jgi:hypothetical protein
MSLRQEILKQIKSLLNEAEMSEVPPNKTLTKCPPDKVQVGEGTDGPICRDKTPAEKAVKSATDLILNPWNQRNQSTGVCPPGQEQTGEGPNGPICSPKGDTSVRKKAIKRGLFDIGSKGPEVKEIQTILATQGFDDELRGNKAGQLDYAELSKLADGKFGNRTAASVKLFQKDMGLPPTGFVDQKTYDAIKKLGRGQNIAGKTPSAPTPVTDKVAGAPSSFRTGVRESRNWADRTREDASTSLFERLVKDVSKKKVI